MSGWSALACYYVIALAIAGGVMIHAGRLQRRRPETRKVLPKMFPWLDERGTYANAVSIARYAFEQPAAWAVWVFASAPTVAGVATAVFADREASIASLGRRLRPWHGVGAGGAIATYLVVVGVFAAVSAVYLRVARSTTDGRPAIMRDHTGPRLWALLVGGMFVDEGGLLEEFGWRGFALPVLVVATGSPWWATIVLAVGWWAWHLPREVPGLRRSPAWGTFAKQQGQFVALCVALSALMTVAWRHTGSVWPAVMIHGGTNVWSKAIGAPMWARTGKDVRTYVVLAAALLVVTAEVVW